MSSARGKERTNRDENYCGGKIKARKCVEREERKARLRRGNVFKKRRVKTRESYVEGRKNFKRVC